MGPFEDEMYKLTKNLEFRYHTDTFQQNLNENCNKIKRENKMIIPADKTTNYYLVDKNEYINLRTQNITKEYKKTGDEPFEEAKKDDLKIATELNIADRVHETMKQDCFITLKIHKPNFHNNPKCRLLNPTKTNLGRVAKQKLELIVKNVKEKSKLKQWKNTRVV